MPRKAPGETWEAYADRQVREAQQRGEFDDLPGSGRPLPDLGRRRDPDWWIRRKLKDEEFVRVPPALELRRDVERARERITAATSEDEARAILETINARIRHANATIITGPPSSVWPLDEERVMAAWLRDHPPPPVHPDPPTPRPPQSRWSRWRARRQRRGQPGS